MQKSIREKGLKRFWSAVKSNSSSSSQCEQGFSDSPPPEEHVPSHKNTLPLLQVWPSADSPRSDADGQSFIFPQCAEDALSLSSNCENNQNDSGIDSTQISPSPLACGSVPSPLPSPTPSCRRPSTTLLHPDHARLLRLQPTITLDRRTSVDDITDVPNGLAVSASSSTNSSLASVAAAFSNTVSRTSDPSDSRRRSSNLSARYSLFDALDLEYALLRAAARGSVGPYSLSESLHKLTFTQSLAFPALARGLASKSRSAQQNNCRRPLRPTDGSLNAFAKIVTALVLVMVSVLVFAVVYKFVKT